MPVEEDGGQAETGANLNVGLIGFCQNCWRYLKASQILSLKEAICVIVGVVGRSSVGLESRRIIDDAASRPDAAGIVTCAGDWLTPEKLMDSSVTCLVNLTLAL